MSLSLLTLIIAPLLSLDSASALERPKLLNRSLSIGSTVPGVTTEYTMSWRLPSNATVGSVRLRLCADPYLLDPCSFVPTGDLSAASLISQSGGVTGFNILSQTADEIIITRTPSMVGTSQSTYIFDNVVNPGGIHASFFIQILMYPTADASGLPNHISSIASATASPIVINTEVPPILFFCVGITVDEWCENVTGDRIDYGDLSPFVTDVGNSQFGAATNAVGGYVVTINGKTMTAGNKLIEALSVPTANTLGTPQFGLNLRANSDPATGQDAFGAGIGTVAAEYDTPDLFKYEDGDIVATSVTGTLFNIFTVSYIVNVPPDQPSGIYNTTIAYICTAAF